MAKIKKFPMEIPLKERAFRTVDRIDEIGDKIEHEMSKTLLDLTSTPRWRVIRITHDLLKILKQTHSLRKLCDYRDVVCAISYNCGYVEGRRKRLKEKMRNKKPGMISIKKPE